MKSHLLPRALTKPAISGMPFTQFREGAPPVRRWSSWYDWFLVTQKGETILSRYDDWAVRQLRRHKLVWSGWDNSNELEEGPDFSLFPGVPLGVRRVRGLDGRKLRLFYLSILWRAAASQLPEFEDICLDSDNLERLRMMILHGDVQPPEFFPISLFQLSSKGVVHNQVVVQRTKPQGGLGLPLSHVPFFRIYFDGLIAHVGTGTYNRDEVAELGPLIVGNGEELVFGAVRFEGSGQLEDLLHARSLTQL